MCTECGRTFEYNLDAEKCHNRFPIRVSGPIPKMKTVTVEVRREEKDDFCYINSCNNLREVPPRAKIYAEWVMPIDENY